jgi:hypothetical protein
LVDKGGLKFTREATFKGSLFGVVVVFQDGHKALEFSIVEAECFVALGQAVDSPVSVTTVIAIDPENLCKEHTVWSLKGSGDRSGGRSGTLEMPLNRLHR